MYRAASYMMLVEMGGGTIAPTITGDHQSRITDYTAIVLQGMENGFLYRERTSSPAISSKDSRSAELPIRSAENLEGGADNGRSNSTKIDTIGM